MAEAAIEAPDPEAGAAVSSADDLLAQMAGEEIDRMLAEAEAAKATEAAAPATPAAAPPPAATVAKTEAAPVPVPAATSAVEIAPEEKAALNAPTELAEPLLHGEAGEPSFLVRLLELINKPLDMCPDQLRDLLGKVAILTLMNSLGLIAYLLIMRRH